MYSIGSDNETDGPGYEGGGRRWYYCIRLVIVIFSSFHDNHSFSGQVGRRDKNKLKEIKPILFIETIEQKRCLQLKLLYFTTLKCS